MDCVTPSGPFDKFDSDEHWSIDRWLTAKERVELGIDGAKTTTTPNDFSELLEKHGELVESSLARLRSMKRKLPPIENFVEISLSNNNYFELFIGKRVLKKNIHGSQGNIPVYSANVNEPFGWMETSNIEDFSKPFVLWGIDGNFDFSVKMIGEKFRTTDHCGAIRIKDEQINPLFVYYALHAVREENRLDRELRANLQNVKKFKIRLPIKVGNEDNLPISIDNTTEETYDFDEDLQQKIVDYYTEFEEVKTEVMESASYLSILEMETMEVIE